MDISQIPYSIAAGLIPLFFYLIYLRHFREFYHKTKRKIKYSKHAEAFLFGIVLALGIILIFPVIGKIIQSESVFINAFIKAALLEKLGAFLVLCLLFNHYPGFNSLEAVISAFLVGAGFSLVENIFYSLSFGYSVILVRMLFSVPLHIATCGIMGYYFSIAKQYSTTFESAKNILKALIIPYVLHGIFDVLLLKGNIYSYFIAPLVLIIIAVFELMIARAKILPTSQALDKEGLRLEDWFLKYRQPRYERWIHKSMGVKDSKRVPFLAFFSNRSYWICVVGLFFLGAAAFPFAGEITGMIGLKLRPEEQIMFASLYPVSLAFILTIVGSINQEFLTTSVIRMPVIFDAVLCFDEGEENLITFDLMPSGCFLVTYEPLTIQKNSEIYFESKFFKSPRIMIDVVWENHTKKVNIPSGSIVKFNGQKSGFYFFVFRYYLFRIFKGLIFNLKLPGFASLRRLFMRPATVMQKEVRYQAGSIVFSQGEKDNSFYLIKSGRVNIFKELDEGERIFLDSFEAGQIFNEMALLGEKVRTVTAECESVCVLAEAKADNLEALILNNPEFAATLVRKLASRADQTQNYLSQTIGYLQDLNKINAVKKRNASLLMAIGLGSTPTGSNLKIELDMDLLKDLGPDINKKDIVDYINENLELQPVAKSVSPKTSGKIGVLVSSIKAEVTAKLKKKNNKPA